MIHLDRTAAALIFAAALYLSWTTSHPNFIGLATCKWPGAWGWHEVPLSHRRVFWLGVIGFMWKC